MKRFKFFIGILTFLSLLSLSCFADDKKKADADQILILSIQEDYFSSPYREDLRQYFISISGSRDARFNMAVFDQAMRFIYFKYVNKEETDIENVLKVALKAAQQNKDSATVLDAALKAAVRSLDPYSRWLNPQELRRYNDDLRGEYIGLGFAFGVIVKGFEVTSIHLGSSAEEVGLEVGDIIVEIDGQSCQDKHPIEFLSMVRAPENTIVEVGVLRDQEIKNIVVVSRIHKTPLVVSTMSNDDIIKFSIPYRIFEKAGKALKKDLIKLQKQGGKKIILDLRSIPLGSFEEALKIADIFLPKKSLIVSALDGRGSYVHSWSAASSDFSKNVPMVVLINNYSVYTAEIIAAALQSHGRAVVMGQRSGGSGFIQEVLPVEHVGALVLSSFIHESPNGEVIQSIGVSPDIEVKIEDNRKFRRTKDLDNRLFMRDKDLKKSKYTIDGENCEVFEKDDAVLNCAIQLLNDSQIGEYIADW